MRRAGKSCALAGAGRAGYGVPRTGEERSLNPLYENMATSVFERMSGLAAKHGAVNLGQGFPDFGWPDEILEAAARALKDASNQYPPSRGLPELREAIAAHYGRHHGQQLDASQICVTSGATEAIGAAILASCTAGDVKPSGPSCPDIARRSVFARPRVRCCSSRVTRYEGHIVPASNLRQWPLLLHISTARSNPWPRRLGPASNSDQSSTVRIGSIL